MIRKAEQNDLPAVAGIYDAILSAEEAGTACVGWQRGVYPTEETARAALTREELYVLEDGDGVAAAAVINLAQVPEYRLCPWSVPAGEDEALVLHTLVVHPSRARLGYGRQFVAFYEDLARRRGLSCLRLDTNARNQAARRFYRALGYREAGIVPCVFNGISGVELVCLEKAL